MAASTLRLRAGQVWVGSMFRQRGSTSTSTGWASLGVYPPCASRPIAQRLA
jgi:hypothetical protein